MIFFSIIHLCATQLFKVELQQQTGVRNSMLLTSLSKVMAAL